MRYGNVPNWLRKLEKHLGFLSLPNLALYITVLQVFGIITLYLKPHAIDTLFLIPQKVIEGEIWRIFTFMAIPLTGGFWIIIVLFFLYFIINTLEKEWGHFPTTFYLLISVVLTNVFAFTFDVVIHEFTPIKMTLFLAAATTFPEMEILMFFFPVRLKWLGILSAAAYVYYFINGGNLYKLYLLAVFSNYFIFFGPAFIYKLKQAYNRKKFK